MQQETFILLTGIFTGLKPDFGLNFGEAAIKNWFFAAKSEVVVNFDLIVNNSVMAD